MFVRSILSAVVAIAACASSLQGADASAASKTLTRSDFDATIADGATFVKFYSPECEHSQKLAPTWEQLAVEHQGWKKTRGFKFAEIDCLAQGDVCEDNDVVSYPSLRVYYKGKSVAKFAKRRTVENLKEFIAAMSAEYINVPSNVNLKDVGEVKVNALGKVVVLDHESFERKTRFGPWLIEYYAPWCGHCRELAPIYEELAAALKDQVNVAKVDCTQNEELCHRERVRGYPTIKLHQHGESIEYNKHRSVEGFSQFALKAIVPSVKNITIKDLDTIRDHNDAAFIYVHDSKTNPEITALIEKQSQIYYEKTVLHESQEPDLARRLSVSAPALVVLKDNRQYEYTGSLTDSVAVQAWIKKAMVPLVVTLTNENTGTYLSEPGWVALALFEPSKPATSLARRELIETAQKYTDSLAGRQLLNDAPLKFLILDATKWESYVRGAFNLDPSSLPAVLVINSREEIFYPYALDGHRVPVEQDALLAYIADIESGLLVPKSMLSAMQKVFRQVQSRTSVVTKVAMKHPMLAMLTAAAFALALMRRLAPKEPVEEEEEQDDDKKSDKKGAKKEIKRD
ncbi:hypothetical protein BGZ99_009104 [Dissophora globulifera]|uniref:Thioredoxin domain-containing protein n=1 Tax=Dissophora globulifera TaxID=979702 RepID=A0A9P6R7U4_9FUNG|nr:hypothetical protein BGZ99_009104 [Dissophora globulifera]